MAFVGDVIISARELMTDLPSVMPPPGLGTPVAAAGTTLPPGTYYFVATAVNQWGESLSSNEVSFTAAVTSDVTLPIAYSQAATDLRIYFGSSGAGSEYAYLQYSLAGAPSSILFQAISTIAQTPPLRSTAYLPDTDGPAVGAFSIYRWLNQGLKWAASKNRGGLPDFSAVGTVNGQPNYVMPGYWKKIDSAWFDGYPLGLLAKNNVFRRNPVPGYSGMLIVFQATDRLMVEAWPQPNRTSNQTTLAAPMTAIDTVANLTSVAGQVLGFGMYLIGSEIVNYSNVNSNQLQGVIRGMGGTVPQAWPSSTPAIELNLMIAGYRVPSGYSVGQAASTFYLPPGWDEALTKYLLYRFRKAEQDEAGAKAALDEATILLGDLSANRIIAGPRQIQPYASIGPEVGRGLGTAFGGVIIP